MAESWVQIANSALTKIGSGLIFSFDDGSPTSDIVKERYQPARDAVLRLHPWNCATKRVVSASVVTPVPAFGFTKYHALPADCLRILSINNCTRDDYRIEGKYIAVNTDPIEITYIKRVEDATEIDSLCGEAISYYLAWDIATRIQQNAAIKQEMWDGFIKIIKSAKSVDAQEEPTKHVEADLWLDARLSYSNFSRAHNNG